MVETRSSKKTIHLVNKKDQNPRKFYSRFLFKALILAVFCVAVPIFLSETPELANQTRLLELLHLVLVGIAVSYGLFSRRNHDGGSHNDLKADHNNNSHLYVTKVLDVSSVFNVGHESESEPSDDSYSETWKNKYHLKIPEVIEKPLFLPVRSLNYSRVSDPGDSSDGWEKVRSKRKLLKSLADDNTNVLPSPIPWRSRSSMETESQPSIKNPPIFKLQPLIKTKTNPPPPPPPPPPLPAYYNSPRKNFPRRESGNEFHTPPPPPPPPPPAKYYKAKIRGSNERKKSLKLDDSSGKRSSSKKVWWSDPIIRDTEKNGSRSFLGSKASEEYEKEEERKGKGKEINRGDEVVEKKIVEEEEGCCGSNNGSDVDKKADEFIAKFREQIRLQRIESIKRSFNKVSADSSR